MDCEACDEDEEEICNSHLHHRSIQGRELDRIVEEELDDSDSSSCRDEQSDDEEEDDVDGGGLDVDANQDEDD